MQKRFDVDGVVQLDVSLANGEILVDEGAPGAAEVELVAHDEDSQALVDDALVELRGSGARRELVVEVPHRRGLSLNLFRSHGITCTIRCPEGSSLRARTRSADIHARTVLHDADVATASGETSFRDVTGTLTAKTASGDVEAGVVGGRASLTTASGDIALRSVRGPVSVNTASGQVRIEDARGDARVNSASGDVAIEAVARGDVSVNSASGDVTIAIRRGSRAHLDCSTVSGDTRSDLEISEDEPVGDGPLVNVKARTVSGDIIISRASASAESHDLTEEVQA